MGNLPPNTSLIPPSNVSNENLRPFTKFCLSIGALPSSYLLSLTYEEQLLWLCHFIEHTLIPAVDNNAEALAELQKLFIELKQYVKDYFSDLNVQDEINNKLDKMAEDGTLAQIINEKIFGDLSNKVNNLELTSLKKTDYQYPSLSTRRIARWFQETGRYTDSNNPAQEYFGYMQGNKVLDDGNFVGAYSCFDDEHKYISNKCAIRVISLSTGNILREAVFDCGHGNCISYDKNNDLLYVTECFRYTGTDSSDSSNAPSHRVFIIKYSDLSLVNIFTITGIDTTQRLSSFVYDEKANKYYATQRGIVYEVNMSDYSASNPISLKMPDETPGQQVIEIYNSKIYQVTLNPNIIFVYDIEGNLENIYNIPNWIEQAFYTGEVEDITIKDNGDIYIGSCKWACYQSNYTVSQVFKINPIHGVCERNLYGDAQPSNQVSVYVSPTFNIDPIGYASSPLNELFEVSEMLLSPAYRNKDAMLVEVANGNYHFAYFAGGASCQINGESNTGVTINGLTFRLMNKVILRNVNLACESKSYPTPIDATMSNIDICNLRFTKNPTKYTTYIKTSNNCTIMKSGTFPSDITSDTNAIIDLGFGCKYIDKDMEVRKNILFSSTSIVLYPSVYPLTDALSITDSNTQVPLNSFLTARGITLEEMLENFNTIIFEFTDGSGGYHLQKFRIGGTTYSLNSTNIANTSSQFYLNEMNIELQNGNFVVTLNQRADKDATITQNVQIALTHIYLSNEF